jgi:hypothetical protein
MASTTHPVAPSVQPADSTGRLSPAAFASLFESFKTNAFRLETLSEYRVESDAGRLDLFLKGEPLPPGGNKAWCELVSAAVRAGKRMQRVHIIPHRLTPYLRYEIEWGYAFTAEAGEEIMLLVHDQPAQLFSTWPLPDFWLFDDGTAACTCVRMHYDEVGHFLFGELITDPTEVGTYRQARDIALTHAVPLRRYLAEVRNS